jgi:prolipoprotein diacylglyceryl transferase
MLELAFIPTPTNSYLAIGPLKLHFYALFIILGVIAAIYIGQIRYKAIGGDPKEISDLAVYAVPAGVIGGRLYHVITSPEKYFASGMNPIDALKIWNGGLGIWGAIALGAFAAYLNYRNKPRSKNFSEFADAIAPALLIAQGIGRWGNWANGELFGKPTTLPWAVQIPIGNRPTGYTNFETFHATFLYESIWCLLFAALLMLKSRKINFLTAKSGNVFLFYIFSYSLGRIWIEWLRIDEANLILGLRLNIWVSLMGLLIPLIILILNNRKRTNTANS